MESQVVALRARREKGSGWQSDVQQMTRWTSNDKIVVKHESMHSLEMRYVYRMVLARVPMDIC